MALLEVRDLRTWFFGDVGVSRAVDGVSFDVEEGEVVGIVGESGCGKTVTALSIMGLVPRPPGRIMPGSSILLAGSELVGRDDQELRRLRGDEIAMIFQEPMTSLNPVYPVGGQIAETLRQHRGATRAAARSRTVELLREVGIAEPERRADDYPHQLSGGMRQRVMIAMSLSCGPRLLIADEPTTALDVTIQAQILELLAGLRASRRMAMLLITHDLGVVAEICDRVLVMYGGQLVEAGTVREIFESSAHPYTRGLLNSLPRIEERRARLRPIPGSVPGPHRWPDGCRFHDRCPQAWERCAQEPPPPLPVPGGDGRPARCWLIEEPSRRPAPEGRAP